MDAYRDLLDVHIADLCEGMEPGRVASRLAKHGVFVEYDLEILASKVTTMHKNEHIVNALMERGFADITKFLCVLSSIDHTHRALAEALQPIKNRIIWFASSPAHAAAVVYTLEKYAGAKFCGMKRVGKDKVLVERRARIFPVEYNKENYPNPPLDVAEVARFSHQTEVCLLFPATPTLANAETVFKSWFLDETLTSEADMILLSGVTVRREGGEERRGRRRVVVGTRCLLGDEEASAGLSEAKLETLETTLTRTLNSQDDKPLWLKEFKDNVPELKFSEFHCQLSDGTGQAAAKPTPASANGSFVTTDPMPFSFYKSCQEVCPGRRSLLCHGEHVEERPPDEGERDLSPAQPTQESESTAAIRCSCILMEVCRHYFCARDQQLDLDDN